MLSMQEPRNSGHFHFSPIPIDHVLSVHDSRRHDADVRSALHTQLSFNSGSGKIDFQDEMAIYTALPDLLMPFDWTPYGVEIPGDTTAISSRVPTSVAGHTRPTLTKDMQDTWPDAFSLDPESSVLTVDHNTRYHIETANLEPGKEPRNDPEHACLEPSCTHNAPFSRKSSLKRHERTVHRRNMLNGHDKLYLCTVSGCQMDRHLWPRLDMFKRHCRRKHPQSDVKAILARYIRKPSPIYTVN